MAIRFLTSGESHGQCLNAIIEGIPFGYELDFDFINSELCARQQGVGRGGRMKIETDKVEITSGIRFGKTIGSPITLEVNNKDHEKWLQSMSVTELTDDTIEKKEFTKIRPGHADLSGVLKYNQVDIRNILERSSARETAVKVAVGAIAKQILENFDINITSKVISIGNVVAQNIDENVVNDLNCPDENAYELMKQEIDAATKEGVTLGGQIKLEIKNVPVGLGSHTHWDRKLDGILAQALMSIQAVKSVEIGLGKECAFLAGNKVHDEIFYENEKFYRKTNNAGGIEGGITNGETLVIKGTMKPIPTMKKSLATIDIKDMTPANAHFERSDVCAVPACSVVAEARVAIILVDEFLAKYGGDSFEEVKAHYDS